MSSIFYIVHHEFKAGKSEKWWETAYAAMLPGGGWDDAVAANQEKGFFNHSANAVTKTSPVSGAWNLLTNSNPSKLSIGAPESIYCSNIL